MIRMFSDPTSAVIIIAVFLTALTIHEFAHGYVAYILGDDTAKRQGRLTLNPLKHLDLFGSLMILFAGVGWAKPVPVNPYNFRKMKTDMALTAVAGPASNFAIAIVAAIFFRVLTGYYDFTMNNLTTVFLFLLVQINVLLGLFNLLPVPPLDGSKIIGGFMPDDMYFKWSAWERNGFYLLMLVFVISAVFRIPLIASIIFPPMTFIVGLLLGI